MPNNKNISDIVEKIDKYIHLVRFNQKLSIFYFMRMITSLETEKLHSIWIAHVPEIQKKITNFIFKMHASEKVLVGDN